MSGLKMLLEIFLVVYLDIALFDGRLLKQLQKKVQDKNGWALPKPFHLKTEKKPDVVVKPVSTQVVTVFNWNLVQDLLLGSK
jgi:hypothetical protein